MSGTDIFRRRTQPLSKAFIRKHLKDSDVEDSDEDDTTGPKAPCSKSIKPECGSVEDLSSCKSWLDRLCEEEQSRVDKTLDDDRSQRNSNAVNTSGAPEYAHAPDKGACCLDTTVLQRIRQGRGPRDRVAEDLLAVFRGGSPIKNDPETYKDMQEVLLSWNERVSASSAEDEHARVMLKTALAKRQNLLRRSYPADDREKALEESSTEMLNALTGLRPEVASFQSQDSLNILTTMWANVRIAVPDLDDELKWLTMKALIDEVESKSNANNGEKVSSLARLLSVAQLEGNDTEAKRLKAKMHAFRQKIHDNAIRKVIDRIKATRRELAQVKLRDLQELTELQAAQMWAAHDILGGGQYKESLMQACGQAEDRVRRMLQRQGPELDAQVQVVQNNTNGLAGMSASLFDRANEAGFSLGHERSTLSFDLVKADVTAYVSGTIADIANARVEAAKMLDRMVTVERHLDELLDAAKGQYRAYSDVLQVVEGAEPVGVDNDRETELAEKYGPRRESLLLMARNLQRIKCE